MDDWDKDPFPGSENLNYRKNLQNTLWEGEDAEEDVQDSWDQEPEEEKIANPPPQQQQPAPAKKSKKVSSKIEEKEKLWEEKQAKSNSQTEENLNMTPEEILADKLLQRKLQEESDLDLAKEVFGSESEVLSMKEDFDKVKERVLKLASDADKNSNFVTFTEELIQGLCLHLCSQDLKKLQTWLGNLHIEKSKLEKGDKPKKSKSKGKAKLKLEGEHDFNTDYYVEDFEDFI